ncbi:hypothetical protein [Nonomuraea fuscirosea]|uniref:hypothetical protein n=1 Tax=Nonomuraea fuscirosea TaxID=1291556 RepID=UPI0011B1FF35|nr:hypothetical protein [Nonomuraea fuscirosea]
MPATTIHLNSWLDEVEHTSGAPPVLFMLDVCGGGQAAAYQLVQGIREQERRAWIIAACADDERTYGARFTRAAGRAIDLLRRGHWDLSPAVRNIPLETVAQQISQELARLDDNQGYVPTVIHSPKLAASVTPPPFFVNPAYSANPAGRLRPRLNIALTDIASEFDAAFDLEHFLTKAAGVPSWGTGLSGCFFTGRASELTRIRDWLESEERVLVVTGEPGAGKSALIGVTVWLAHPSLQPLSLPVLSRVPSELHPRRRYPTLVGVHARQRTAEQVVDSLHSQLDRIRKGSAGLQSNDSLERLIEKATGLAEPVIVVIDAIDESIDGETLVNRVLARLLRAEREDGRPAFRIMAGVRPWWDQFGELARWAGAALLCLDLAEGSAASVRSSRAKDLAQYFSNVLALSPGYSIEDSRESVAHAVAAELVTGRYTGGHLLATLYASHLGMRSPLDAATAVIQIPRDLPAMLNLQLEPLEARQPWLRLIMTAVASGMGQGMPLDLVHVATKAFIPVNSFHGPTLEDVRDALESAAFYLRTHVDAGGRRLYNFFHQSLTDYFRDDSSLARLFAQLMSTVPTEREADGFVYRWDVAPPYLQAHALDHAVATGNSGTIDRLLLDPRFLQVATGTLEQLPKATSRSARRVARALRPFVRHVPSKIHDQSLQLDLVRCGGLAVARHLDAVLRDEAPVLSIRWSTDNTPTGMTACLGKLDTRPTTVAIAECDDTAIALIGGADGSIQAWDSLHDDGRQRYLLPDVHEGGVQHLVVVEVQGEAKVISYGADRLAVMIDVGTGSIGARAPLPGTDVTALAPARELDSSVFLAGHMDGTISVIGVTSNSFDRLDVQESGERAPVTSLACSAPVNDEYVQLRCVFGAPEDVQNDEDTPPSLGILDTRPIIIEGGWNGSVRISEEDKLLYRLEPYDRGFRVVPVLGEFVRVVEGVSRARNALASRGEGTGGAAASDVIPAPKRDLVEADIVRVGDVRMAVTAHEDGYVRVWDLDLVPWPGLLGRGTTLFITCFLDREVAVAVSTRPVTVKAWDIETGAELAELLGLGQASHTAVAVVGSELLALTATAEEGLDLYDVVGGYHLASIDPQLSVTALGLAAYDSGALAVVGSADGNIDLWLIADGEWRHLGFLEGNAREATGFSFTRGSSPLMLLATFADSVVRVWSLDDLTAPHQILFENDPDRRVLTCSDDGPELSVITQDETGRIEVWDPVEGILRGHIDDAPRGLTTAGVSIVDGKIRLVTNGHAAHTVHVWDAETGEEIGPPVHLPYTPSRVVAHSTGIIASSWSDVAALDWSDRVSPDAATGGVSLTHVLSWFPGEILSSGPEANAWDLQTWESWMAGEPANWEMSIPSADMHESPRHLRHLVAQRLEPEGFDLIDLEPGEFEISVPDIDGGRWRKLPLYHVFTLKERPGIGRSG